MRRVLRLLALTAVTASVAWPTAAQAAEDFAASIPQPRQELSAQPSEVRLAFTMSLSDGTVTVQDSAGRSIAGGNSLVEINNVSVQLITPVPRGTYTVKYRVDSAETGKTYGGSYQFSVGAGRFTEQSQKTFGGPDNVPAGLGGSSTPTPSAGATTATPSPTATATKTPSPTAPSSSATPDDATEPTAEDSADTSTTWWPWLAGLVVALLGGGAYAYRRVSKPR